MRDFIYQPDLRVSIDKCCLLSSIICYLCGIKGWGSKQKLDNLFNENDPCLPCLLHKSKNIYIIGSLHLSAQFHTPIN